MLPLVGVRVVDFSQYLAGPYCTMQLADYGADVIKVERIGSGDDARGQGPKVNGESYPFQMPNRNKRSVALNMKSAEGKAVALDLISSADIVIENFRPGVTAKLGIDYDSVGGAGSPLIYCSISGFGQTGPISARPGFDIIAQGMSGMMRITGEPGGEPVKVGVAISDLTAGLNAAVAICMAYIRRLRDGAGQYIDVALLDSGLALTVWEAGAYFGDGEIAAANGSRHRRNAPYQAYRTADGYLTIGANNQKLWEIFCHQVIEQPKLIERPEFRTGDDRISHVESLAGELTDILATRTTAEWAVRLDTAGVPGGPVLTYDEALAQEQVAARHMIVTAPHKVLGDVQFLAPVAKLSDTPPSVRTAAPMLGEHTTEVLRQLGYNPDRIDALTESGAIAGI